MSIVKQVLATILDHHFFASGETVLVAVSGGPDSLALIYLLHELSAELEIKLHIAHLNHGLRGDKSDGDAAFVAETAAALGLPWTIQAREVLNYAREGHLSLEEAARILRYRFLAQVARSVGARSVAVGHNADDQVETVLMHMLRGAGLAGLRGMTHVASLPHSDAENTSDETSLRLVRPLLETERSEIEAYCQENHLIPRLDESNLDTTIFRNRLRREVIPYLEQMNPNLRQVIRHSAHALSDDYDYLSSLAQAAFSEVVISKSGAAPAKDLAGFVFERERWRALPPSLQRATLREALRRLRRGLRNINWAHIEDARHVASEKGVGAEATLPQGLVLIVGYDEITIGETVSLPDVPLLHVDEIELHAGEAFELPESGWQVKVEERKTADKQGELNTTEGNSGERGASEGHEDETEGSVGNSGELGGTGNKWAAELDADKIRGRLIIRTRRAGERFEPKGMGGHHKSLHEFMIEEKIPRHVRDLLPILADEEKVLWVCGYRIDRRAQVSDKTERITRFEFYRLPESV